MKSKPNKKASAIVYLWFIFVLFLSLIFSDTNALAAGVLCNATEKKVITTWGGYANITWRNPNLNGGWLSYHRVSTVNSSVYKFVEWGPAKTENGFAVLLAWDDGYGVKNEYYWGVSAATHTYSHQYDPITKKYWFYVDGVNFANKNAGFSNGNFSGAGGEAGDCVEKFNSTRLYSLRYLRKKTDGTFVFTLWNGHVDSHDDPPYYNTNGPDVNSFYDKP